jgi:hypothetical protein
MKTALLTLLATAALSLALAASAFAAGSMEAAATAAGSLAGAALQQPGTSQAGGVGNLPNTSTDLTAMYFALGAVLATFGSIAFALRGYLSKR